MFIYYEAIWSVLNFSMLCDCFVINAILEYLEIDGRGILLSFLLSKISFQPKPSYLTAVVVSHIANTLRRNYLP